MSMPEGDLIASTDRLVARSIDDRTPLEAAIARADQAIGQLDHLLREHAERLAPILTTAPDGELGLASEARPGSERVSQVHYLADRLEVLAQDLQQLTGRVEA